MQVSTIGVDLAKNVFQVHGVDSAGKSSSLANRGGAAAICEAVTRPSMRFVPIKSADQQALLMLHRTRDLLIRQRTQLINALRAHLAEFGLVAETGLAPP